MKRCHEANFDYSAQRGRGLRRRGDYSAWMADGFRPARARMGCGLGFGTAPGCPCIYGTCARHAAGMPGGLRSAPGEAGTGYPPAGRCDGVHDRQSETIEASPPMWSSAGSSAHRLRRPAPRPAHRGKAAAAYREAVHRHVAELAAQLRTVRAWHRSTARQRLGRPGHRRDTLLRYHLGMRSPATCRSLPSGAMRSTGKRRAMRWMVPGSAAPIRI